MRPALEVNGSVDQLAAGDIYNHHHWFESQPPDDPEFSVQCPQCRRLTWRYSKHCVHCDLNLAGWRWRKVLRSFRTHRLTLVGCVAAIAMALSGCATTEQRAAVEAQDFGPPPPDAWKENVKAWFDEHLKDPESARYRMGCPVKAYMTYGMFDARPGISFVGYAAQVQVNAKNSYGGYTGHKGYVALIARDGLIADVQEAVGRDGWNGPRLTVLEPHSSCISPTSR